MSFCVKFLVLQLIVVTNSWAYHNGAPLEACTDLVPKHGFDSQPTSDDHKLVLDNGKWNFRVGEKINLTLTLVDEHRAQFKGFLIQVIHFFQNSQFLNTCTKFIFNSRQGIKIIKLLANFKAQILKCNFWVATMDIKMPSLTWIIVKKVKFMPLGLLQKISKWWEMESNSSTLSSKKNPDFGQMNNHRYWSCWSIPILQPIFKMNF